MKKTIIPFENHPEIYKPADIVKVLEKSVNGDMKTGNNKKIYIYNIPCAFDIETTSFYSDRSGNSSYSYKDMLKLKEQHPGMDFEKRAIMYVWQFGINGCVIVGREWHEFMDMIDNIVKILGLNDTTKLIIYVHNLSYEFQYMRKLFKWKKVFSIDERKPIYALTENGIEFRCSYLLTGYSLAKVGEHLQKYKVAKMVGDLDYSLLRHSSTPLTEKETGYIVNDVKVVMSCIQEKIEESGNIHKIPLTKTGYVRRYCRDACLYFKVGKKRVRNFRYQGLIEELNIYDLNEFETLQRAFQGGFTHANSNHVGKIMDNVSSYDFTSSYPAVMVCEQYPMSAGIEVKPKTVDEMNTYIDGYCSIMNVRFTDIITTNANENILSSSKCYKSVDLVENNGRVYAAKSLCTTLTNVDYKVLKAFYRWSKMEVFNMYVYKKDYLPKEFICSILDLYKKKTTLKGVNGREVEYLNSKELLNSCYGMTVTNPLRDEFTYTDEWGIKELTIDEKREALYKYNISKNRFLFYVWGVFVTAYARRNLFTAIYTIGDDYIYSDTDSVKIKNGDKYKGYFTRYNAEIYDKLKRVCMFYSIPVSSIEPETIKGVKKVLGVWDYEGDYLKFITLGAKRYMVKTGCTGTDKDYSLTVAGLDKRAAIPYLFKVYKDEIMDNFNDMLYIPSEGTGKNTHTYIDIKVQGYIIDYKGVKEPYFEASSVHLEPTDYTLNLSFMYLDFLRNGKHLKL